MVTETVVDLSRLQFAITALFHFLFVPLTLGLSWLLVIMESVYVMTGKEIYKDNEYSPRRSYRVYTETAHPTANQSVFSQPAISNPVCFNYRYSPV